MIIIIGLLMTCVGCYMFWREDYHVCDALAWWVCGLILVLFGSVGYGL